MEDENDNDNLVNQDDDNNSISKFLLRLIKTYDKWLGKVQRIILPSYNMADFEVLINRDSVEEYSNSWKK